MIGEIVKPLSNSDIAYLAGFFDGEGYVGITKNKQPSKLSISYVMRIVINQSGEDGQEFLKYWQRKIDIGVIHSMPQKNKDWKIRNEWAISSNQASDFLGMLLPYLVMKKDQAKLAIEFQESKKYMGKNTVSDEINKKREWYYLQLREMKNTKNVGRPRTRFDIYD